MHIQSCINARIPVAAYAILGNDTFTFERGSTHPQSSNHQTRERKNAPQPRPLPRKNPIGSGTQLWPTRERQDHFPVKTLLGAEPSSGPPEKTKTMPRTPFTRHPCTGLCQCTVPLGKQNRTIHRAKGFSHCSYCERLCIEKDSYPSRLKPAHQLKPSETHLILSILRHISFRPNLEKHTSTKQWS